VTKPVPAPDRWSAPYWEAARQHRLTVQQCDACGVAQYPPDVSCANCQGEEFTFAEVSGEGTVYSFAVFTRSLMPSFAAPYVIALVDLADRTGVRLMTNIVEVAPEKVEIGMSVEVTFEARGDWAIPQFRPRRLTP
jgi:uncharacterized protein